MRIPSSVPSRAIAVAVAMILVAVPPALMTGGQAQSTSDCWNPDGEANSYVEAPLWIGEFSYSLHEQGHEDSFVDGRVAFVHPGDTLVVEFEVVNRVPENCEDVFDSAGGLEDVGVCARNDFRDSDPDNSACNPWWKPDQPANGCGDKLNEIGGTCSVRDKVPVPEDIGDEDFGEYRLRYLARDEWDDSVLVGAERVVVVGLHPDLEPESDSLKQVGDWRTVYGTHEYAEIEFTVTNTGDYPYWNPNGGTGFWGRPSTDTDADSDPDHRAKLCRDDWIPDADEDDDDDDDRDPVPENCDAWPDGSGTEGAPPDGAVDDADGEAANRGDRCDPTDDSADGNWCDAPEPDARDAHAHPDRANTREKNDGYDPVQDPRLPPCIGNNDVSTNNEDDEAAPPWDDAGSTDHAVCSYRRGARLDMPIQYELRDPENGDLIDVDVIPSNVLQPTPEDMDEDKGDAIQGDDDTETFDASLFDLHYRAGEYEMDISVGRQDGAWVSAPEVDRGDNNLTGTVLEVKGADLTFESVDVSSFGQDEVTCGEVPDDPCPAELRIRLEASVENVGYDPCDGDDPCDENWPPYDRSWKAIPYQNGEQVHLDDNGFTATDSFNAVPVPDVVKDLWDDSKLTFAPGSEGGKQIFEIRLDPPDLYSGSSGPSATVGAVAEKTEGNDCPDPGEDPDNVWCRTFYFEDDSAPEIGGVDVDAPRSTEHGPAAHEGENVTFVADVTDSSLEHVNATFELPNGTTQTAPMGPSEGSGSSWTLTRNFTGVLGNVTFTFNATDAYGHFAEANETANVTIEELPKEVEFKALELNGEDVSHGDDHDHEGPEYQGTASNPDNWVRVEANVTGTGLDESETAGKNVTIHNRTGGLEYDLPMGVYTVCDIWNTVTDEREGTGEGDACEGGTDSDVTEVRNNRSRFFVDTRCEEGEDPEENAGDCQSASEDLREAWKQVEIDWAGSFDVTVRVTDAFNRTGNETSEVGLADVDDEPSLEVHELGPDEIQPGADLEVAAHATDGLQVERVHLELERPDGTNETFNLTLPADQVEDAETKNGTYEINLSTGRFETLDQAGVYEATVEALDLAGKTNRSTPASFEVVDDEAPEVQSFTSVPAEIQEVGGPVTWELDVADATALKDPILALERPSTGTTTHTLVYNETTGLYELEEPIESVSPNVGNWTYELEVEDWAGNVVQVGGYVEVVENLAPQVQTWEPDARDADGRAWGPADPTIRADLVDFGHGVNESSIEMTVDGETVSPEISKIEHGYQLLYDPGDALELSHRDVVTVRVSAADRSTPDPLVADEIIHQFTIDARAPNASVTADPSVLDGTRMIVGPDSAFTVDASDDGAGPSTSRVLLQRVVAGTVEDQQETEVEPGAPFQLSDVGSAYAGHGDYHLQVTPVDRVGNEGEASSADLTADAMGPAVTVFPKPDAPPEMVFADISDASSVESAEIIYKVEGEEREPIPMQETDGTWQGEIPSFPKGTTVRFRVQATDLFGNVAGSDEKNFSAGDTPPEISIEEPQPGAVLSGPTTIAWTASDAEVEDDDLAISFYYRQDASSNFRPIPDAQEVANTGSHTLDTTWIPNGEVTLQAIAFDGSTFGDDRVTVQVRNLDAIFENIAFEDAEVEDGKARLSPGEDAVFNVELQNEARTVWANVTRAGETIADHRLERTDDGRWRGTIATPEEPGTYEIDLSAVTDDGPVRTEGAYSFEVASDEGVGSGILSPWVILSVLFAGTVAAGSFGLSRKW